MIVTIVQIEGEDQLCLGGDGSAVEGGGVEAPGLHCIEHELVEGVAQSFDEGDVDYFAERTDIDIDDHLLLDRGEECPVADGGMRRIDREGRDRVGGVSALASDEFVRRLGWRSCRRLRRECFWDHGRGGPVRDALANAGRLMGLFGPHPTGNREVDRVDARFNF